MANLKNCVVSFTFTDKSDVKQVGDVVRLELAQSKITDFELIAKFLASKCDHTIQKEFLDEFKNKLLQNEGAFKDMLLKDEDCEIELITDKMNKEKLFSDLYNLHDDKYCGVFVESTEITLDTAAECMVNPKPVVISIKQEHMKNALDDLL